MYKNILKIHYAYLLLCNYQHVMVYCSYKRDLGWYRSKAALSNGCPAGPSGAEVLAQGLKKNSVLKGAVLGGQGMDKHMVMNNSDNGL